MATDSPTLSRELTDFLVEFSVSIHKLAIYPDGHPLVEAAVEGMRRRLDDLMSGRKTLALGVARNQLIVDGVATDPHSAVLRELAHRLSRREIGAVRFDHDVDGDQISSMLRAIAREPSLSGAGRGAELAELSAQWPQVRLFPLTYDQLELLGDDHPQAEAEEKETWATHLWVGLARAALSEDPRTDASGGNTDASTLARAIEANAQDANYGREIIAHLAQFSEGIREHGGAEAQTLRKRVAELVSEIDPSTMQRLLTVGADAGTQRKLVVDASHVMAVDTVLDLAKAAADAAGETLSGSLLHLLSKLARHASTGQSDTRAMADAALRENVRQLVSGWKVGNGSLPGEEVWQQLSQVGGGGTTTAGGIHPCEPERVIEMSIEIGTVSVSTRRALDALVDVGRVAVIIDLLDRASELNDAVELLREQFDTPETLSLLLRSEPVDREILHRLVGRLGPDAIDPLIGALDDLQDRKTRWQVLEMLASFGQDAGTAIVARLPSAPWYVQRNLLSLVGKLPEWPAGFSPAPFLRHTDARVRREALRLLLADARTRVAALCEAIGDSDEHVARMALSTAAEGCPPQAVGPIIRRIDDRTLDMGLRMLGVRAVARSRSPAVRDCMLRHTVVGRRGWFRRQRLAGKSPLVLAALGVLATSWSSDAAVGPALRLAGRSGDPEVRGAVGAEVRR